MKRSEVPPVQFKYFNQASRLKNLPYFFIFFPTLRAVYGLCNLRGCFWKSEVCYRIWICHLGFRLAGKRKTIRADWRRNSEAIVGGNSETDGGLQQLMM